MFAQWDDHEVTNNWWPGEPLTRRASTQEIRREECIVALCPSRTCVPRIHAAARRRKASRAGFIARSPMARCSTCSCSTCAATAVQTASNRQTAMGRTLISWANSRSPGSSGSWRFARNLEGHCGRYADRPPGVYDGDRKSGVEAIAQGDDGPPRGRELEIADLLAFIKRASVRNTVWLTADVHYTAAHYYDPNKAVFQDFEPFWQFVSGPLHAGHVGPNELDATFGPAAYVHQGARARNKVRTCRRATACSSSVTSRSTARPSR